jgi:hypothetical protein
MTNFYSVELAGIASLPVVKVNSAAYAAPLRRYRATVLLAAQNIGDNIYVAFLPAGDDFAFGVMYGSVSLGTSTVAIGITGQNGKYRAASVFTAVDIPTPFGTTAQNIAPTLAVEDQVFISIAAAALPASGNLSVEHYCSRP